MSIMRQAFKDATTEVHKKNSATTEESWEEISGSRGRVTTASEQVAIRFTNHKGGLRLGIHIGRVISDLYSWTDETRLKVLRSSSNPNFLKLVQSDTGNLLSKQNIENYSNLRLSITVAIDAKRIILNETVKCNYETVDDGVIIDISGLVKK